MASFYGTSRKQARALRRTEITKLDTPGLTLRRCTMCKLSVLTDYKGHSFKCQPCRTAIRIFKYG